MGFMRTESRAESEYRVKELIEMGLIANFGTILDNGFLFFYTEKGEKFAQTVSQESKEVGMSPDEYVDIFVELRRKGDLNGNDDAIEGRAQG